MTLHPAERPALCVGQTKEVVLHFLQCEKQCQQYIKLGDIFMNVKGIACRDMPGGETDRVRFWICEDQLVLASILE